MASKAGGTPKTRATRSDGDSIRRTKGGASSSAQSDDGPSEGVVSSSTDVAPAKAEVTVPEIKIENEVEKSFFEVEKIKAKRYNERTKRTEFLIKWKGYDRKCNSWEPETHLNCPAILEKFETSTSPDRSKLSACRSELCQQEKVKLLEEKQQLLEENRKMEEGWRKSVAERRILQNQLLDLKGNVRVFCRLRPPLANEPPEITAFQTSGPYEIRCFPPGAKSISFTFDRVLNQDVQQEEAFEEVSALLQTALDGYKVCVFAYGQTGSGKTYTMVGDIDGPNRGIIPRATDKIFETIEELKARDWIYGVKVSILEVHNEKFTDLINPDENGNAPEIYADQITKEPVFVNLFRATAENRSEVQDLIRRAQKRRDVAAMKCNERPSSSHCVFLMQFSGTNSAREETNAGSVYLVDLTGSEHSEVSGAKGTRLKETDINVSLSTLDRVFVSIMKKQSHIPYGDSKLTHCLQPCLGRGNCKVLIMAHLSPFDVNESLNTLRFAKKVNQCPIGTAQKKC